LFRIFFATDIHGSDQCWRKFVNAGVFYDAKVLVMGGDIIGKAVLLVERGSDGLWRTRRGGRDFTAADSEVDRLCLDVRKAGFYPYLADTQDTEAFRSSEQFREEVFERLVRQSLAGWLEFAESRIKGTGRRLIVTSGNDDPFFIDDILKSSSVVEMAEGELVQLDDGHEMINLGWTNPTPWNTHRECAESDLAARIDEQADRLHDPERAIFNFHAPPYNSGLDTAPKLDENLRPVEGGATKVPVGSTAVRAAIDRYRPMLGLHGHVHEGRGATEIGRTLCLNPGSVYSQGLLAGSLVNIRNGAVKGYQLVEG
jgi:Icc-related predicted phosphoesterase